MYEESNDTIRFDFGWIWKDKFMVTWILQFDEF